MNKLDEIRQILRDKEDFSYTVIDKLIDIIELQEGRIAELEEKVLKINKKIE